MCSWEVSGIIRTNVLPLKQQPAGMFLICARNNPNTPQGNNSFHLRLLQLYSGANGSLSGLLKVSQQGDSIPEVFGRDFLFDHHQKHKRRLRSETI